MQAFGLEIAQHRIFLDELGQRHYADPVAEELSPKSNRRRTLLVACVGVILGFTAACLKGPTLVSLSFKPLQGAAICAENVNAALTQFVELQLGFALFGGLLALVVLFFSRRYLRQRAEARQGRAAL